MARVHRKAARIVQVVEARLERAKGFEFVCL